MVTVGAGVAALGAGAYYLLGPNAKAHQKKAKDLMAKMNKEIMSKIATANILTKPLYNKAVDILADTYSKQYKAHGREIKAFAEKLKSEWKGVPKFANKTAKKAVKTLKNKRA